MKKRALKITNGIFFAFIVSCILVSSILFSEAWGRYFTRADGGDGGRVAGFYVSSALKEDDGEIQSFSVLLKPSESSQYTVLVTNDSEVAVRCTLEAINQTNNLPLSFTLEKAGGGLTQTDAPLVEEYGAGTNATYTYQLTVTWSAAQDAFTYQGMVDHVVVRVRCEQMD